MKENDINKSAMYVHGNFIVTNQLDGPTNSVKSASASSILPSLSRVLAR